MDKPAPPPEADLIRLAREALRIKMPAASRAAGLSVARWSQIERGYETRRGRAVPVSAPAATLAHMAAAVRAEPDRLEQAGRRDAAEILREILRRARAEERPVPRYDDPALQRIWEMREFPEDVRKGMIALARGMLQAGTGQPASSR